MNLLTMYKELFDITLGEWDTPLVHFELENATPLHDNLYPISRIHLEIFKKKYINWGQ